MPKTLRQLFMQSRSRRLNDWKNLVRRNGKPITATETFRGKRVTIRVTANAQGQPRVSFSSSSGKKKKS